MCAAGVALTVERLNSLDSAKCGVMIGPGCRARAGQWHNSDCRCSCTRGIRARCGRRCCLRRGPRIRRMHFPCGIRRMHFPCGILRATAALTPAAAADPVLMVQVCGRFHSRIGWLCVSIRVLGDCVCFHSRIGRLCVSIRVLGGCVFPFAYWAYACVSSRRVFGARVSARACVLSYACPVRCATARDVRTAVAGADRPHMPRGVVVVAAPRGVRLLAAACGRGGDRHRRRGARVPR